MEGDLMPPPRAVAVTLAPEDEVLAGGGCVDTTEDLFQCAGEKLLSLVGRQHDQQAMLPQDVIGLLDRVDLQMPLPLVGGRVKHGLELCRQVPEIWPGEHADFETALA